MLDLIARLAIASTALACSTFAFIACDTSLAPTPTTAPDADGELAIVDATLESGATVGWDFDVAIETVASQFPTVLDISIPVDLEPAVPTRIPRAAAAGNLQTVDALARPVGIVGEVRLLDAITHEVLFTAPVDADRRASTAWIDVRVANPCKGRVFCQRPFRLELTWPGPTATRATADLTHAVDRAHVRLGR